MDPLSTLSSSPAIPVGLTWFLTSVFMTMPSTSRFLLFDPRSNLLPQPALRLPSKSPPPLSNLLQASLKNVSKPMQLTLWRFTFSKLLSLLTFTLLSFPQHRFSSPKILLLNLRSTLPTFLLPALCLFLANLFNSLSLSTLGISLTYVTKCSIPIFTLLMGPLFEWGGETEGTNWRAKVCLMPICVGIGMTSYSNSSFTPLGLFYALTSCLFQVSLNILSKKKISTSPMTGPIAGMHCHLNMVIIGFFLSVLKIIGDKIYKINFHESRNESRNKLKEPIVPPSLALKASLSYHLEYTLSFILISLIHPLTYGVSDAIRRLGIIVYGKIINPKTEEKFNKRNVVGMGMALVGGVGYSVLS